MTARMLAALLGALLVCAAPAAAEPKTFAPSTGASWAVDENWSPPGVPGPADDVTVGVPAQMPAGTNASIRSLSLSGGSLTLDDATLTLGSGSSVWSAGSLGLSPGSRLNVSGPLSITVDAATVANVPEPLDSSPGKPAVAVNEGGHLTRPSGTSLTFETALLAVGGTVALSSGTTSVANAGDLDTLGSTILIGGGSTLDAGAPLSLDAGVVGGSGTIARGLTHSAGTLSPGASPGRLVIDGNYTQSTANAVLRTEIAGTATPDLHDQLRVNGTATLRGQLAIEAAAGYQPGFSAYFDVVSANTVQGTFATLTGHRIGTRATYKATYQSDRVRLLVAGPTASSPPVIPGTGSVGKQVICTPGAYQQSVTYRFEWIRETSPFSGGPVVGTLQTYTPTAADAGQYLACRVTASNNEGADVVTAAGLKIPAPPGAVVVPPAIKPAEVFTLPSARRCVSRRKLRIRVRQPKGTRLVSVAVYVNRKRVKTNRGTRVTATVNLKGLPKGTYKVRIVAKTADGRTITDTRRYRTCTGRRPR